MDHPNLDGLSLHGEEEEEEGFRFDFDEEGDEQVDLRWCLVGRFLCDKAIHFNSMRVRMADLWKPVKGVTIKEAKLGTFLFHFAHPLDMEAVLNGGPWTFDNNMLILEQVPLGMQIEQIPLFHATLWVQIHDLPTGLMKETVGQKLANYIGSFVEYDKNNNTSLWRKYMRIRVRVDVRLPLKKDTKVMNKGGEWCTVKFKYEKLGIFCFICGVMGHAESRCEVRYAMEHDDGRREWSAEIRAEPRRQGGRQGSRWLREEGGVREEQSGGFRGVPSNNPVSSQPRGPTVADVEENNQRGLVSTIHQLHAAEHGNSLAINDVGPSVQKGQPNHNVSSILSQTLTDKQPTQITINPLTNQSFTHPLPFLKVADIILNPLNTLYVPSSSNNSFPLLTKQTETDNVISPLLPNQTMTFNSQAALRDPPKALLASHKNTRGMHKQIQTNRTRKINQHDPVLDQPRPDKKTKNSDPKTTPTQNPIPKTLTQHDTQNIDVQGEKKRRRDEEKPTHSFINEESMHFLSAGPGSQDCQDQ
jgi:hypothetical protein